MNDELSIEDTFLEDKINKRIELERVNYFWLNV